MGYSTTYTLEILNVNDSNKDAIYDFTDINEDASYAIDENGDTEESCKWYDHADDLKSFSKKYPDTIFKLSGEGEDSGDIWSKYFKNGKVQFEKAKIVVG